MAQSLHWEGLRMRLLIELPLTIALFTLAVKYGWPYTVVFVLGYILAFNFKLPYLSRRAQVSTRFLVFLGIFLAFAMTASMIIGRFFFSPSNQTWVEAHRIWNFLLVTPSLKVLWAAVIGFGLIALIAAVILIPYGQVAGQQMYSQYEQYKGHEGEAARTAINILLGISGGTWVISGGQAEVKGDPNGALARFGGPGFVIVQQGHAVILEISGKVSDVIGSGITWLKPFERISMVVPLFLRSEKITVEKVATKDKVLIDEFEIQVYHKADPGPPTDSQTRDGQFAYIKQKLLDDVWSPSGGDWRGSVRSVAETATRDVVGRFELEEIVPISDTFRTRFKETLTAEMNKVTAKKMGVLTVTVDIGKVKIPEESEARLLKKWSAQQQIQIAESRKEIELVRGKVRVSNLRDMEAARAVAQEQMIMAISAGFGVANQTGNVLPATIVQLRMLEALEKIAEDPAAKLIFPSGMNLADLPGILNLAATTPQIADGQDGAAISTQAKSQGSDNGIDGS
jgi:regulator of protease activity HflC (stomatin/prohibitin superfamily)